MSIFFSAVLGVVVHPLLQTRGWMDDATRCDVSGPTNNWPTAKLYALFWFDVARREWNVANPESTPEHYCYDRVIPCHRCPPNASRKWYTPVDDASNQPRTRNSIADQRRLAMANNFGSIDRRDQLVIVYQAYLNLRHVSDTCLVFFFWNWNYSK